MKQSDVSLRLTGESPGRPPLLRLKVEAILRNPAPEPRWFGIPSTLPAAGPGGVDGVTPLVGDGVVLGKLTGTGGHHVVRVAGGATLTLQNLEIGFWDRTRARSVDVEVIVARDAMLGDKPLATWFDREVTSTTAIVDAAAVTAEQHRATPDGKEVPLTWPDAERLTVTLSLAGP